MGRSWRERVVSGWTADVCWQADISFHTEIDSDIRTLSTNGVTSSDDIDGFLYVPDLNPSDPCVETSKPYVPANVTRQGNLPTKDYDLVALAPWISANCTLSYLAAARSDPARAFIFYRPDHHDDRPPPINDASWTLNDGGQWKSRNRYPVYAVSGQTGDLLMTHLARYSGNLTEVEQGHELAEWFDPRDYARLYADIPTSECWTCMDPETRLNRPQISIRRYRASGCSCPS